MESVRYVIESRGGKLLTKNYSTSRRILVECSNLHIWSTTIDGIIRKKWCPICAIKTNQKPKDVDMIELARRFNGKFIGPYVGTHTPTLWECSNVHRFKRLVKDVRRGLWCTLCHPKTSSTGERLTRYYFEFFLDVKFPSKYFGHLQVDGPNTDIKIAFEYDGPHHFQQVGYSYKSLEKIRECDSRKEKILNEQGIKLFRIPYTIPFDRIGAHIKTVLTDIGCCITKETPTIDEVGGFYEPMYLNAAKLLAERREYKLVSTCYLGVNEKHDFVCPKGHKFSMILKNFKRGYNCPTCRGYNKTVGDMKKVAEYRNGDFLSNTYEGTMIKHRWRCKIGHVFLMSPDCVLNAGQWCPFCYKNRWKRRK